MADLASQNTARYAAARPFPHIALDGFFDEAVLDHVLAEFPAPRGGRAGASTTGPTS